jgi:hypothetical protein
MNTFYSPNSLDFRRVYNLILTLLVTVVYSLSFSQTGSSENPALWSRENFATYDQQKELLDKRDANSKHFLNADGTITALLAAGDFHYWEDNRWKTIFHSIVKTSTGFENVTNSFKTTFPELSSGSITTQLPNSAGVIRDMINMRMYYEVNGNAVQIQNILPKTGTSDFNELNYNGIYGPGIDLKLTQHTTKRKMDYILQNQAALGAMPAGAEFLIFEETVELPSGWIAKLENNVIQIINESGFVVAIYEQPIFSDTPVSHEIVEEGEHAHTHYSEINGTYELVRINNVITIKTKVPCTWLFNSERNFPVFIDPTINCVPDNTASWTGYIRTISGQTCYSEGCANYTSTSNLSSSNDEIWLGREYTDEVLNGWARFNVSSIPQSICINSASVNYNIFSNNSVSGGCNITSYLKHMANDPVPASNAARLTDIRDGDVYAATNFTNNGSGWVSKTLTANLHHIINSIPTNQFSVGFHSAAGGSHTTCQNKIRGRSHSDRPYLAVNYTPLFLANFVSQSSGCADWLPGETRNVSITVQNTGCTAWTSGGAPGNDVNFAWWGNWAGQHQDANPRMFPYANLTQGNSQVITFSVTAPMTPGAYTISADNVRDGYCWFRNNNGVCGPGNGAFSFNINVTPTAAGQPTITGPASVCTGGSATLSLTGTLPVSTSYSGNFYGTLPAGWSSSLQAVQSDPNLGGDAGSPANFNANSTQHLTIVLPSVSSSITWKVARNSTFDGRLRVQEFNGSTWNTISTVDAASMPASIATLSTHFSGSVNISANATQVRFIITDRTAGRISLDDVVVYSQWQWFTGSCQGTQVGTGTSINVSPVSTTTYYAGAYAPCGVTCGNFTLTVGGSTSTAPTSITGGGTICQGNAPTLTSVGGTSGPGAMNVWYTGGCNNAFTQTWNSNPYTTWSTTVNSISSGIMSLTSTTNDPMIEMPLLGSFNPAVYRYVNVRYRVTVGTAGAMELFFHNAHYAFAHGDHHTWTPLISDNQWHIASLDLTQNAHFLADASNITGWRYDWATNSGVTMELDFIQLSQYPMIDENSTDAILALTPGTSYYPAPGTTVTYASGRIDDCSATGCASTTVTLPAQSAILATNGQQATCTVNANETVSFFHVGTGNYIATVTAGGTGLGSVTATVYDDGAPLAVPACGDPSPLYITSVMERHWVITPTTNGSANVWLPYYNTELASLTTAANANANGQDDVAGQGSVLCSKYSGGAWPASVNVDSNPFNNCAPPVSTGVGGTILIGNNAIGTVQSYLATFPATTLYSRFPITGFSEFWLHGAVSSPLPIILSDFSATCDDEMKISWSTSSEVNSDYFVVEKSRDGLVWEDVETVVGKGLSTTLASYVVVDEKTNDLLYYRLKQVDIDGNTTYFGPISVDCNAQNRLTAYPNPSNGEFTVEIFAKGLLKDVVVAMYDVTGKVVSTKKVELINGLHTFSHENSGLEKGTYLIGIVGEHKNDFTPIKVVIQ